MPQWIALRDGEVATMPAKALDEASQMDLLTLTAAQIQGLLHREDRSSVELTTRYLEHIERHNKVDLHLNAVISSAPQHRKNVF